MRTGLAKTVSRSPTALKPTKTATRRPGQRLENLENADVVAHARRARRNRRPIWTNPFTRERAALWRKSWRGPRGVG